MTKKQKADLIYAVITEEVTSGTINERIARRLYAQGITEQDFIDLVCGQKKVLTTADHISCNVTNWLHDLKMGYDFMKDHKPVLRKVGRTRAWK